MGGGGAPQSSRHGGEWECFSCSYGVWDADVAVSVTGILSFQSSLRVLSCQLSSSSLLHGAPPALSPHIFARSRGGDAAATADRARPHAAPALMRCSCFQIQPLILILFHLLNMAPKGTSVSVVFCVGPIVQLSRSFRGG